MSVTSEADKFLYLAGINVTHSIAPPMHNFIAQSLNLNWKFIAQECPTVESVIDIFRLPTFAGGVVTMPYKKTIMPHLDELDTLATTLGACNNVYLTREGKLRGTNTDWRGVKGCLLSASPSQENHGRGKPALIIGAGGAARAALYALFAELKCGDIYIVNRDAQEVADLLSDSKAYASSSVVAPRVVHILSISQAETLAAPYYVVGTVPDFEPHSKEEILARDILEIFLSKKEKGVLLDMCFKPRVTRSLKLASALGWKTAQGTGVIGHQIQEQWRLWAGAGENGKKSVPEVQAWEVLNEAADRSTAINF